MQDWTLPDPDAERTSPVEPAFHEPGVWELFKLVFEQSFRTARVALLPALLVAIPSGILSTIFAKLQPQMSRGGVNLGGAVIAMLLLGSVMVLAYLVLFPLAFAAISWVAARSQATGTVPSIAEMFQRLGDRGPAAIGTLLLLGLLMFSPAAVIVVFGIVGAATGSVGIIGVGFALSVPALIVVRVVLGTRGALAAPVVMEEGISGIAAIKRSSALVNGRFARIFWLLLLTAFVAAMISALFSPTGASVEMRNGSFKVTPSTASIFVIGAGQILGGIITTIAVGVKRGVLYAIRVQATTPAREGLVDGEQ